MAKQVTFKFDETPPRSASKTPSMSYKDSFSKLGRRQKSKSHLHGISFSNLDLSDLKEMDDYIPAITPKHLRQPTHPLLVAARQGSLATLGELASDESVDVNLTDSLGWTALIKAAVMGDVESCKLLLTHGADMSVKAESGANVLHFSVLRDNYEVVAFLLSEGADPNFQDDMCGWRPLHSAIFKNNLPMVKLLLKYGADPKQGDYMDSTPINVAGREEKTKKILQTLQNWDPSKEKIYKPNPQYARKIIKPGKRLTAARDSYSFSESMGMGHGTQPSLSSEVRICTPLPETLHEDKDDN